jgi:hypothetical protein
MIWLLLVLYFIPPLIGLAVGPSMELWGRVWLFNVVYMLFWPLLFLLLPFGP